MSITASEAKKIRKVFDGLKAHRTSVQQNQLTFWKQYGVTQSGGSRYESGREMDAPLRALVALHVSGKVDDETLANAMRLAKS